LCAGRAIVRRAGPARLRARRSPRSARGACADARSTTASLDACAQPARMAVRRRRRWTCARSLCGCRFDDGVVGCARAACTDGGLTTWPLDVRAQPAWMTVGRRGRWTRACSLRGWRFDDVAVGRTRAACADGGSTTWLLDARAQPAQMAVRGRGLWTRARSLRRWRFEDVVVGRVRAACADARSTFDDGVVGRAWGLRVCVLDGMRARPAQMCLRRRRRWTRGRPA
jgi:hypothetical protein